MNSLTLLLVSAIILFIGYVCYGGYLAKKWGVDDNIKTPAHTKYDGVDYVPAKSPVLLGHHFASIAGAGPIVGPIQAAVFGWIPVALWVLIGSIFFGGVQDFGSLFASIRHDGKSIGEIIEFNMGRKGKKLFSLFAWLTLVLVVAAFANIVADNFVSTPQAASASMFFIILAILFGIAVYRFKMPLIPATIVGVILLFGCIYLGFLFPIVLSKQTWIILLMIYIFVASVTPVWILLQPRDYLNSYLLYAMIIGALLGIFILRPEIQMEGFVGFNVEGQYLFPFLFVTVACGAISGFHSLVGSGTSSKQLYKESDAKKIGYGAMLIEGLLAIVALITVAYISNKQFGSLLGNGGPVNVFSEGIANFMMPFGIPFTVGKTFTSLAISAFALTSLDTATRLGRFIFQEFFDTTNPDEKESKKSTNKNPLTNMYISTIITVVCSGLLAVMGYEKIWPIFGSANQLLAAIALMAIAIWLANSKKSFKEFIIPIIFMFIVTIVSLCLNIKANIGVNYALVIIAVLLLILALILIKEAISFIKNNNKNKVENK
ncbi:carbon starvation protein CstA [[Clostridium] sordellii]|uniref:Carbon starvation protein A n=1 Tax=Paraclostridium sordellii TaxID=1505 RepID=A0ABM9RRP5_PARSO|nr:carbon starvation protein A [Paeniclostridium sordellii]CEJ74503.1 carbon starvation protein A [[Clostridium] sordellii] [Paeniclostridium sordellii]CEN70043.1 carbon starvation protein CstA [[Clostridium] sordellii] [Paeniclostridium sordellii]CEN73366.1 carbon starvation protein CstA [[Clostridium] sordellii] [Paeniclostridium sordellii]CEO29263.1 carbon starvation protein CstA [[Clostridium] sordellii] [Paeniclostridium sordellii]CEP38420.1 carbon starvation protein CstA [[Clostridium] s